LLNEVQSILECLYEIIMKQTNPTILKFRETFKRSQFVNYSKIEKFIVEAMEAQRDAMIKALKKEDIGKPEPTMTEYEMEWTIGFNQAMKVALKIIKETK
jgi:ABC-type dipeptide/oligopeptide/nickel transport system ATPase component